MSLSSRLFSFVVLSLYLSLYILPIFFLYITTVNKQVINTILCYLAFDMDYT